MQPGPRLGPQRLSWFWPPPFWTWLQICGLQSCRDRWLQVGGIAGYPQEVSPLKAGPGLVAVLRVSDVESIERGLAPGEEDEIWEVGAGAEVFSQVSPACLSVHQCPFIP